ncbi:hypothetical protein GCM10022207_92020 [Streptomyces lannensis]|uniref:Transposase n=1 Tax=Streptomyces lannensis TaxID=766498 RepID=A0ABP7LXT1_9ACTN
MGHCQARELREAVHDTALSARKRKVFTAVVNRISSETLVSALETARYALYKMTPPARRALRAQRIAGEPLGIAGRRLATTSAQAAPATAAHTGAASPAPAATPPGRDGYELISRRVQVRSCSSPAHTHREMHSVRNTIWAKWGAGRRSTPVVRRMDRGRTMALRHFSILPNPSMESEVIEWVASSCAHVW